VSVLPDGEGTLARSGFLRRPNPITTFLAGGAEMTLSAERSEPQMASSQSHCDWRAHHLDRNRRIGGNTS